MKDLQRGYVDQFAENLTVKRTIQLVVVQFAAMNQNSVLLPEISSVNVKSII